MAETKCFGTQAKYISPCFDPKYFLPHPPNLIRTNQHKLGTSVPLNSVYYMKTLKPDNGSVIINFPKASLVSNSAAVRQLLANQ